MTPQPPPPIGEWPPDYVQRMDKHVLNYLSDQVFWDWAEIRGQLMEKWRIAPRGVPKDGESP